MKTMDRLKLDAASCIRRGGNPPRLIGDLNSASAGDNSQIFSALRRVFRQSMCRMGLLAAVARLPVGMTFWRPGMVGGVNGSIAFGICL